MLKAVGIITVEGGTTCHAAVVARGLGKPAVIGTTQTAFKKLVAFQDQITLDATNGKVWRGQLELTGGTLTRAARLLIRWRSRADGVPRIRSERCLESHNVNEAVNDFYLMEAMYAACDNKAFKAEIAASRTWLINKLAEVFATYLVLAVTSEVTHAKSQSGKSRLEALSKRYSLKHRTSWEQGQVPLIAHELEHLSFEEVVDFFKECAVIFRTFTGGGYGGPKWAHIAEAVQLYFEGEVTAEVFVDRAFDLQHNGGPVFNKHHMVPFHRDVLKKQLDAKRQNIAVGDKYRLLLKIAPGKLSAETETIYQEGKQKGLWS